MNKTVCVLASLAALAGCVEKSKRLSKAEQEIAKTLVTKEPGNPQHKLDIRFENKIRLLGYDLSDPLVREGQTFQVTWYWQVDAALGEGWKLFTHLADGTHQNRINLDGVRPSRRLYPAEQWKKGDFITDLQEVTLPPDWNSPTAIFYLGFWNGPHRLHVTVGPSDGENRAEALKLPVADSDAALPRLIARRTTAPLTLDGKLDEADWVATQPTTRFVQTMTGEKGSFEVSARVLYDEEALYVGYRVVDDYLKCTFEKPDDHLWEQDTVELMVDPDGDGKNYFEIQVSPTGLVFDTRYDSRRQPRPFGDMAWSSQTAAKVLVSGKPNDDETDEGYDVEMAVPWRAFAAGRTPAAPPAASATWRMNFFVMDARKGGQRAVGWSPPMVGDFHTLERFGRVVFPQAAASKAGVPTAVPIGPPAPR